MSRSRWNYFCGLMLCGCAWSSCAIADNHPKQNAVDAQFNAMDTNSDGKLSPAEHAAGAKSIFGTMDANRDGTVTPAEMDAVHEKVTGKKAAKTDLSSAEKIKVVDTDGDGVLTAEEHAAGSKMMFDNGYRSGRIRQRPSWRRATQRC